MHTDTQAQNNPFSSNLFLCLCFRGPNYNSLVCFLFLSEAGGRVRDIDKMLPGKRKEGKYYLFPDTLTFLPSWNLVPS